LVAAVLDSPPDQLLVDVGAVDLGGVEVGDAQVERTVNRADGLGVAAFPGVVVAGHRHGAESYARDIESADRDVLHNDLAPVTECLMWRSALRLNLMLPISASLPSWTGTP
jgi:hypothetical protein